jgi:hypothetical protein
MFCLPAHDLIGEDAVKEALRPVIQRLIQWRHENGLSQRGAFEVMKARNFEVSLHTLKGWEIGHRHPGTYTTQALTAFLREHPVIEDAPIYPPGSKPGYRGPR